MENAAVEAATLAGSVHDMSAWGMFINADLVVKTVMLSLMMASVWTWTIIVSKRMTMKKLNRQADRFEESFWSGEPLDKLYQRVKKSQKTPLLNTFTAGMEEWQQGVAAGIPSSSELHASLRQRIERAMSLTISREVAVLERGMTFLASCGSTATFIGLFGTVWGIMRAFIGIAGSNDTSLAVVAPGIAEALFATAMGLVAAIPAVVAYNIFSNSINRYADRLDAFTGEFTAILSRHLDKRGEGVSSSERRVA
jgi:biopolymer transport protein TolQ